MSAPEEEDPEIRALMSEVIKDGSPGGDYLIVAPSSGQNPSSRGGRGESTDLISLTRLNRKAVEKLISEAQTGPFFSMCALAFDLAVENFARKVSKGVLTKPLQNRDLAGEALIERVSSEEESEGWSATDEDPQSASEILVGGIMAGAIERENWEGNPFVAAQRPLRTRSPGANLGSLDDLIHIAKKTRLLVEESLPEEFRGTYQVLSKFKDLHEAVFTVGALLPGVIMTAAADNGVTMDEPTTRAMGLDMESIAILMPAEINTSTGGFLDMLLG